MQEGKFISFLYEKLKRNFDIDSGFRHNGEIYELFAKSHVKNIRTFLTKKDIIDCYENNEFIFVKIVHNADINKVKRFVNNLVELQKEFVKPNPNHMSTVITGILLIKSSTEDIKKYIKKFKHKKVYKLYLHGWSEVRIVLVDLTTDELIFSKAAKPLKKVLEAP
jgi:hypothetical protein